MKTKNRINTIGKSSLDQKLLHFYTSLKRVYTIDKSQRSGLNEDIEKLFENLRIGTEYREIKLKDGEDSNNKVKSKDDNNNIYTLPNDIYGRNGIVWLESLERIKSVYCLTDKIDLKINIVNRLEEIVNNRDMPAWPMNGHDASTNGKYK